MNPISKFFGRRPAPRRAPPVVSLIGSKQPRLLDFSDFAEREQIVGVQSVLAAYVVPRGELFELDGVKPFRLALKARVTIEDEATDPVGGTILDLAATGVECVRSTRPAPALPSSRHPDVVVYATPSAGGATVRASVSEYKAEAGTVSVALLTPSTNYDFTVYVLHGNGSLKIRAVQPSGTDSRATELFNDSFRALHETDQANGITAPRLMRGRSGVFSLAPKWEVSLEVNTSVTIAWDADAEHLLEIHGNRLPVNVNDPAALNAAISGRLR